MTALRRLRGSARRLAGEERASEVMEAALVLPILLTLVIGIFWLARAYNIYETIARAAREGARASVAPSCATCGDAFLSSGAVQSSVATAMAASGLATSGQGISINVQQHQQLKLDANNPGALWTVVTVTYPFKFALPFTSLNWTTITMRTTAQMVEEQ